MRLFFISLLFGLLTACTAFSSDPNKDDEPVGDCRLQLNVIFTEGRFSIGSRCGMTLSNAEIRFAFVNPDGSNNWVSSREYRTQASIGLDEDRDRIAWPLTGREGSPDLVVVFQKVGPGYRIDIELIHPETASGSVTLRGYEIVSDPSQRGGLYSDVLQSRILMLHNGYQSWGFSGVEDVELGDERLPRVNEVPRASGDNNEITSERSGASWWFTALRAPNAPKSETFLLGALTANIFKNWTSVEMARSGVAEVHSVFGMTGDVVNLRPGKNLVLESLYIGSGETWALIENYAGLAAEITPRLNWQGAAPRGWGSWYQYYSELHEEDIHENAEALVGDLQSAGYDMVQIDDGYEPAWGDWTHNDNFTSGLDDAAARIETLGLRPAIWIAPFHMSTEESVYRDHPNWFVKDKRGDHIIYNNFGPNYAVFDMTHPEAATYVTEDIKRIVGYGYHLLKVDFLFSAAYEADYHKPNTTSMQHYHLAMEALRKAAGENVYIIASGAPMLPSLGQAHAWRTGPDIAFEAHSGGAPSFHFTANEARHTASRAWVNDYWYSADPDNVMLREPLTENEAKVSLVAGLAGGGVTLLGDRIANIPDERRAWLLDQDVLDFIRLAKASRAVDLFSAVNDAIIGTPLLQSGGSEAPSLWLTKADDDLAYLAAFNWTDQATSLALRDVIAALEGGTWSARELLAEADTIKIDKISSLSVSPASVRWFELSR